MLARLADDAVARRREDLDAAVELVGGAGQQRVHRRVEAERGGGLRHVVHLAVGQHDDAGEAVGRGVGQRLVEIGEKVRAGRGHVAGARGRHPFDVQIGDLAELGFEVGLDRGGLRLAVAERLAGALVDDDDGDVGEALALLLAQRRIGERGEHGGDGGGAQQRPARAAVQQIADEDDGKRARRPEERGRQHRCEIDRPVHALCLIARAVRAAPARAPGRLCSCRSARA